MLPAIPALLSLFVPTVWAAGPIHKLSLKEAIVRAVERSPGQDSARKARFSSELELSNASVVFLPQLSATAGTSLSGSTQAPAGTSPWNSSAGLSLAEQLYDNGRSWIGLKEARINSAIAASEELRTRDQLSLSVAQEFFRFSLLNQLLKVREEQHRIMKSQFERASNQHRQGLSTRQDFLRFQTQVQRSALDLEDARVQLQQSASSLRALVAGPLASDDVSTLEFEPIEVPLAANPQFPNGVPALEKTHEFRIAEARKNLSEIAVERAGRERLPQVDLSGTVSYDFLRNGAFWDSSRPTSTNLSWSAVLSLKHDLWDWGTDRRNAEIARLQADIRNDALDASLIELRKSIDSLGLSLGQLQANFKATREFMELSQNSYDLLDRQYRLGQAHYLDLITGLRDLLDAKVRFFTAYFGVRGFLMQHAYYEGSLYEAILQNP